MTLKGSKVDSERTLVMACATVIEEMLPHLPPGMDHQVFDFGLHVYPDKLRSTLQAAINAHDGQYDTIILGYGMCSQGVVGIKATHCTLVVPRVDDCISIFLGSRAEYLNQNKTEPGTYYLTKGWIEVGDTPFDEYERITERYGAKRAQRVMQIMLANYKRLALINTGQYDLERYREYSREIAERFDLRYEEIKGSDSLVKKLMTGDWDDEFVVVPPGEEITYKHFQRSSP